VIRFLSKCRAACVAGRHGRRRRSRKSTLWTPQSIAENGVFGNGVAPADCARSRLYRFAEQAVSG
jgi:hypothetical protein